MIKLLGLNKIDKNFKKQINVMSDTLQEGFEEVGERGVAILRKNTPVKDGRLRNSMSYTTGGKVVDPLGAESSQDILRKITDKDKVIIGTNVVYGPKVEYTAKNGSAGYMLRSYKQLVPIAKQVLSKFIGKRF